MENFFRAFDKKWFARHQRVLLWLLNTFCVRIWFLWVMRINGKRSSVGRKKIIKIEPNAITWREGERRYSSEFRAHDKYSKRLYYAFKPLWWAMHFWDWLVGDRLAMRLSFGFSVL